MSETKSGAPARRFFLGTVGAAATAATVASLAPSAPAVEQAAEAAAQRSDSAERKQGYQLTEHVRRYYQTTLS